MNTDDLILAALSPADSYRHTPVQVQKLFFLIDRQISDEVSGPHFHFEPYHYGPFDRNVYDRLDSLAKQGLIIIEQTSPLRTYSLTVQGIRTGRAALDALTPRAQNFIRKASDFVRNNTFSSLVSAIYKAFPEMRKNSVFQS